MKKENESYQLELVRYNKPRANLKSSRLFENLPELIVPEVAAKVLGKSVKTLYDWNYRGQMRKYKIPFDLFIKIGGGLYMKRDALIKWVNRNSS